MKYYEYKKGIHVFETMPSEGALVAHGEDKLTKVKDINHDWFASRNQWHKIAAINCSFFNGDGTRNGSSMEDGQWQSKPYEGDPWVELIWSKGQLIIADLKLSDLATLTADFVKGVKPLIRDGIIDKSKKQVSDFAPRTAIGQRQDGMIIMMATDDRPFGLSSVATVDLMQELGCHNAAMLDGGGSSTMVINNETVNYTDNRAVTDALIFYSEKELEGVKNIELTYPVLTSVINKDRQRNIDTDKHYLVNGRLISSLYGPRTIGDKFHDGVDFLPVEFGGSRDSIYAAHAGIVSANYISKSYGRLIIIDGEGFSTIYGHLSLRAIALGDKVEQGDKIGEMGDTGTKGVHLHFELRDETYTNPRGSYWRSHDGEFYSSKNPLDYMEKEEKNLDILSDYDILLARIEGVYRDLKAFRDKL